MSTGFDVSRVGKNLSDLIASLEPKQLKRAIRNTLNVEARKVAKVARQELSSADIHNAPNIAKQTIRATVWKKKLEGFAVRATFISNSKSANGMYRNSKGKFKPLGLWFDQGTDDRYTKGHSILNNYRGRFRGSIQPPLNFMNAAAKRAIPEVERRILKTFEEKVNQQIWKYGR